MHRHHHTCGSPATAFSTIGCHHHTYLTVTYGSVLPAVLPAPHRTTTPLLPAILQFYHHHLLRACSSAVRTFAADRLPFAFTVFLFVHHHRFSSLLPAAASPIACAVLVFYRFYLRTAPAFLLKDSTHTHGCYTAACAFTAPSPPAYTAHCLCCFLRFLRCTALLPHALPCRACCCTIHSFAVRLPRRACACAPRRRLHTLPVGYHFFVLPAVAILHLPPRIPHCLRLLLPRSAHRKHCTCLRTHLLHTARFSRTVLLHICYCHAPATTVAIVFFAHLHTDKHFTTAFTVRIYYHSFYLHCSFIFSIRMPDTIDYLPATHHHVFFYTAPFTVLSFWSDERKE